MSATPATTAPRIGLSFGMLFRYAIVTPVTFALTSLP
jgi:hypothetical protein